MTNSIHIARLMNLMRAFRNERESPSVSNEEEFMLAFIIERGEKDITTTVSNLVASQFFGTPPTVQRRIDNLVKLNFLVLEKCAKDSRKQNLVATILAKEYFEDLSRHVSSKLKPNCI